MNFFKQVNKQVFSISMTMNWLAALCVTAMMVLTCADVVLRLFRRPIPGTYEMVSLLGAMVVSFSLAHTSLKRGHIAVDFVMQKFSSKVQRVTDSISSFFCTILFGIISWHMVLYAVDLQESGEVSMTLQMPVYPFVYAVAAGCGMLCIVLLIRFIESFFKD